MSTHCTLYLVYPFFPSFKTGYNSSIALFRKKFFFLKGSGIIFYFIFLLLFWSYSLFCLINSSLLPSEGMFLETQHDGSHLSYEIVPCHYCYCWVVASEQKIWVIQIIEPHLESVCKSMLENWGSRKRKASEALKARKCGTILRYSFWKICIRRQNAGEGNETYSQSYIKKFKLFVYESSEHIVVVEVKILSLCRCIKQVLFYVIRTANHKSFARPRK